MWLDGLDGPLINALNVLFFENYDKDTQGVSRADGDARMRFGFARPPANAESPGRGLPFRYRWEDTDASLHKHRRRRGRPLRRPPGSLHQPGDRRLHHGDPVLRGADAQAGLGHRHPPSHQHLAVPRVPRPRPDRGGRGVPGMGEGRLVHDPQLARHRHENPFEEEAVLFSMNDRPVLEALQLYREEPRPGGNGA